MSEEQLPSVAVVILCYNEEKHIGHCLETILRDTYDPSKLRIYVVDGRSTDRSREIVEEYRTRYPIISLVDNPARIKPVAFNLGIQASEPSDLVIFMGAHSHYSENYISRLVAASLEHDADNIGGALKTDLGDSSLARAIGIATSHPFAAGNAIHRTVTAQSYGVRKVGTVFGGCYKRSVFERIGLFNEKLIRAQDREFNARLEAAGGKILMDPSIVITYCPRIKLFDYARWQYDGGFWVFYADRFTETRLRTLRNIVPLLFLGVNLVALLTLPISPWGIVIALPVIAYWILNLVVSLQLSLRSRQFALFPILFFLFPIIHYGYALGSIKGILQSRFPKKDLAHA